MHDAARSPASAGLELALSAYGVGQGPASTILSQYRIFGRGTY